MKLHCGTCDYEPETTEGWNANAPGDHCFRCYSSRGGTLREATRA